MFVFRAPDGAKESFAPGGACSICCGLVPWLAPWATFCRPSADGLYRPPQALG
jgi:hypothetical protein